MAEAVVKRLVTRKLAEVKDETRARELVRRILVEDLTAEEKLDADVRALLLDHAKEIRDSASDYRARLCPGEGQARQGAGVHAVTRMSRERLFALADRIVADLTTSEAW